MTEDDEPECLNDLMDALEEEGFLPDLRKALDADALAVRSSELEHILRLARAH